MGGRLQKIAAIVAAASAFAGGACAADRNASAYAGATAITSGWRASLFVTRPPIDKDASPFGGITTIGARLSRPLTRHVRVSVDAFNVLGKSPGTTDYFTAAHGPCAVDPDALNPAGACPGMLEAGGRGLRLGLKITF